MVVGLVAPGRGYILDRQYSLWRTDKLWYFPMGTNHYYTGHLPSILVEMAFEDCCLAAAFLKAELVAESKIVLISGRRRGSAKHKK